MHTKISKDLNTHPVLNGGGITFDRQILFLSFRTLFEKCFQIHTIDAFLTQEMEESSICSCLFTVLESTMAFHSKKYYYREVAFSFYV